MDALLSKVQEAFKSAFDIDPGMVTIDTQPADIPEWDSMGHVALAASLERVMGMTFDIEDLMEMEDVGKIVKVLQLKLAGASVVA
jgi:acyl carrier protein